MKISLFAAIALTIGAMIGPQSAQASILLSASFANNIPFGGVVRVTFSDRDSAGPGISPMQQRSPSSTF